MHQPERTRKTRTTQTIIAAIVLVLHHNLSLVQCRRASVRGRQTRNEGIIRCGKSSGFFLMEGPFRPINYMIIVFLGVETKKNVIYWAYVSVFYGGTLGAYDMKVNVLMVRVTYILICVYIKNKKVSKHNAGELKSQKKQKKVGGKMNPLREDTTTACLFRHLGVAILGIQGHIWNMGNLHPDRCVPITHNKSIKMCNVAYE